MPNNQKIIWSEGMFLQPQHFQQQDRYVEYTLFQTTEMLNPHFWGISELQINHDFLKLGKFSLDICRGIFQDGTLFNIQEQDNAPLALDIPDNREDTLIYLALPLKRNGFPETQQNKESKNPYRYGTESIEIHDSNQNSELSAHVNIGKLSLRLMLETENREGYVCIAIARIQASSKHEQIHLDPLFIPTCLNIHALPLLHNFTIEIQSLLHYRSNMLVERIKNLTGGGGVAEIADFMLLQLVNRFEPIFIHFIHEKKIHPQKLYLFLFQLSGELATFTESTRRSTLRSEYKHSDLEKTFTPLQTDLRKKLSQLLEENAISIPLQESETNTWVAIIADKTLFKTSHFVLGIRAKLSPDELRRTFLPQIKISPVEEIRNLINRALPGIALQMLNVPPRQIPYYSNYMYFMLDHDDPLWKQTEKSSGLAFHISGIFPELKLEFWAIKG